MKNLFLVILASTIILAITPRIALGQITDNKSETYILSDKQAQSQTKAMVLLLNLKEPVTTAVYQINLKYLLQTNSLRISSTQATDRKNIHALIIKQKNEELKSTLSPEQYNKYILVLEKARAQLNTKLNR